MYKNLLTLIFTGAVSAAMAQVPTVGSELIPVVGQKTVSFIADTVNIEPGASGANVSWDFSNLKPNAGRDSVEGEILSPSKTPYGSDFPSATAAAQSVSGASYIYYNTNGNKAEIVGMVAQAQGFTMKHIYTNTLVNYTTPITYNYTHSDDFAASYTVQGIDIYRYGNTQLVADGYGSMKLGNKTYNNVLRLKSVSHETDSIDYGFSHALQYIDQVSYVYVTPGKREPLLTINYITTESNGQRMGSKSVTYNTKNFTTGLDENVSSNNAFTIYPNPAKNALYIKLKANENMRSSILIVNQLGQTVQTLDNVFCNEGENTIQVNLQSVAPGVYLVKVMANNQVTTQKLIIE